MPYTMANGRFLKGAVQEFIAEALPDRDGAFRSYYWMPQGRDRIEVGIRRLNQTIASEQYEDGWLPSRTHLEAFVGEAVAPWI